MRGASRQVVQAYLGFKLGMWSYNPTVKFWEPVVEPWDVIAQCAANYGSRVSKRGCGDVPARLLGKLFFDQRCFHTCRWRRVWSLG